MNIFMVQGKFKTIALTKNYPFTLSLSLLSLPSLPPSTLFFYPSPIILISIGCDSRRVMFLLVTFPEPLSY